MLREKEPKSTVQIVSFVLLISLVGCNGETMHTQRDAGVDIGPDSSLPFSGPVTGISPDGGEHVESVLVSLTCFPFDGLECGVTFYTLDGSEPTIDSKLYVDPVLVDESLTFRYFSISKKGVIGPKGSADFVIKPPDEVDPRKLDSDADGLSDYDETEVYFTAPHLSDTDGDGFNDYQEVIEFGYDPTANNLRFNPRIADLPQLQFNLTAPPEVGLEIETSTGSTSTISNSDTVSNFSSTATSNSSASSTASEVSHRLDVSMDVVGAGAKASAGAGTRFAKAEASAGAFAGAGRVSANYSLESTTSSSQSFSHSESQSQGNSRAAQEARSLAQQSGSITKGGYIRVPVNVVNTGHVAFTLKNMVLSATKTIAPSSGLADQGIGVFPIGNLSLDAQIGKFPIGLRLRQEVRSKILFFRVKTYLTMLRKTILQDSDSLLLNNTLTEVVDVAGIPFSHRLTTVETKTATVIVDYVDRTPVRHRVATRMVKDQTFLPADEVLDVLKLSVQSGQLMWDLDNDPSALELSETGIIDVDGEGSGYEERARWILHHVTFNGDEGLLQIYDLLDTAYDLSMIEVRAGDIFHLIQLRDEDLDTLGEREEFLRGTSPTKVDSDDDGIDDNIEIEGIEVTLTTRTGPLTLKVFPSPTDSDSDRDGLGDGEEFSAGLNPTDRDSDGDGLLDGFDPAPSVYNETDVSDLQLTELSGTVSLSWVLPDLSGLSLSDYQVMILRQGPVASSSTQPAHYFNLTELPQDNFGYSVGNGFRCDSGSDCYTVVHYGGGSNAVDTNLLGAEEAAKYLAFVRVNHVWRPSSQVSTISTGVLTATMKVELSKIEIRKCVDGEDVIETDGWECCKEFGFTSNDMVWANPLNPAACDPGGGRPKVSVTYPDRESEGAKCDMWWRLFVNGNRNTEQSTTPRRHNTFTLFT